MCSSQIKQQSQSESMSPVIFSSDEDVELAFSKLSAFVTSAIEHVNFNLLQRAAIEGARSSKKSGEIVPIIKAANSFQNLCTLLADTLYWNFNVRGNGNCIYDSYLWQKKQQKILRKFFTVCL